VNTARISAKLGHAHEDTEKAGEPRDTFARAYIPLTTRTGQIPRESDLKAQYGYTLDLIGAGPDDCATMLEDKYVK
jgi:hypothetical protein